jgi:hypothetical protein
MATRIEDLKDLAINIKTAIEQARRLNLPTSVYILSMVQLEVSQAMQVTKNTEENKTAE